MYKKDFFKVFITTFVVWLAFSNISFAKTIDKAGIKVFKLANGQTLVVKEVHTNPIVTVDTWVKTGSINENDKNNGVSHFLEHLFFKGTEKHIAGEADKILETKGAVYNAATSKDFTHFYTTIPSKYLQDAMDLQSDMLLNATFPNAELDKERKVVQAEIKRADDNAGSIVFNNLNNIIFKHHPYRYETLGTPQIIGSIPRQSILDYYHRWYLPQNMVTIVVGDVDTNKVKALVEKDYVEKHKRKFSGQIKYPREPELTKPESIVKKGDYNVAYLELGFKGVPITDIKDNYSLDVLATILGDGDSSRLYQSLKEKTNIVTSIDAGHMSLKDDSVFYISSEMKPENYKKAKEEVIKQINKVRVDGITDEELNRAKKLLERQFLYNSESVEEIANTIGYCMTINNNLDCYTDYTEQISKLTKEDIKKVAVQYIDTSKMAESLLLPQNANIADIKPKKEAFKNTEKYILNNGTILIVDKNESNKTIALNVFFKGGNLNEPIPGINSIIASTLMKGTANRSSLQIANELENLGIIISPSADSDYFEISLKSTYEDFNKALDILADIINHPKFTQEDIQQAKTDIIEAYKAQQDSPSKLAFEGFLKTIYPNHPYGYDSQLIIKNLPNITREKILAYYSKTFVPQNMIISSSGNIDGDSLSQKITSYFPKVEAANVVTESQFVHSFSPIPKNKFTPIYKDVNTAWIVLGWKAPSVMNEKEYASLKVINSILGSGLSSRLFVDLREKQGLAYEIASVYPTRADNSYYAMYMGTQPESIKKAIDGFLSESDKLKKYGVTQKELEDTKQRITGQFLIAEETNQEKSHYLGWFEVLGKGYLFNYNYPAIINAVTIEDVKNTANKYLSEPYAITVIAPKNSLEAVEKEYNSESKR
ncbi:MAG: pitrilysin family protein [bacterium]